MGPQTRLIFRILLPPMIALAGGHLAADEGALNTPRITGVSNDESYVGTVRPAFSADAGVSLEATIARNGGDPETFRSDTPVYLPGDYVLTVRAKRESDGRTRTALINFTLRRASLAILDVRAGENVPAAMGTLAVEVLKSNLVRTNLFDVVERERVDQILKEQALQKSGCTDTECAVQIGQLLSAHKILVGKVSKLPRGYLISVSIMDVAKGRLDFAQTITIQNQDELEGALLTITKKISARILGVDESLFATGKASRGPFVWRSMLLPGWGQMHEGDETKGMAIAGAAGGLFVIYLYATLQFNKAQEEYRAAGGLPAVPGQPTIILNYLLIKEKREALATWENRLNISAMILGAFWIWNVFDAYFFPWEKAGEKRESSVSFDFAIAPDYSVLRSQDRLRAAGAQVMFAVQARF